MKPIKKILILFFSVIVFISNAQNLVYVSTSARSLYIIDLSDCSSQFIGTMQTNGTSKLFRDIALHPTNGKLYGIDGGRILCSIDTSNANVTEIVQVRKMMNALTFSKTGVLYGATVSNDSIYTIDITSGLVTALGSTGTGIRSSGDLTFIEDDLYLAGVGDYLVKVDVMNISNSDTVGQFSNTGLVVYGVSSALVSCQSEIYAFSFDGIYKLSSSSNFLQGTNLCSNVVPGIVWGASPITENSDTSNLNLGMDTTLCPSDSLTLNVTVPNASYLWHNNSTDSIFTVTEQGQYFVEISIPGCTTRNTFNISYDSLPTINLGNDTTLCLEDELILNSATPNVTYLWQDNSTDSIFLVTEQGQYSVQLTANCGTINDTINIDYKDLTIELGQDTSLCEGNQIILNATIPEATYLWNNNSNDSTLLVTQQGKYWVQITTNCGINSDTININYIQSPEVNLGNDTTLCVGEELILSASTPNATYSWNDISSDSIFKVTQQGTYIVQATNFCGTNLDTINVTLDECSCFLFTPNAFTPNADGINDEFSIESNCEFTEYDLMIYNRWGQKIIEITNPNKFWDGLYENQALSNGMFTYELTYKFENSNSKTIYGNISLVR